MEALVRRIADEGTVAPNGLLRVDGFVNHRLDPAFVLEAGSVLRARLEAAGAPPPDLILTAEASGVGPAFGVAAACGVPLVVARKRVPATWAPPLLRRDAVSRTHGDVATFAVRADRLPADATVWLIDDVLARGATPDALAHLAADAGARVGGVGVWIEKAADGGRAALAEVGAPVVALARIEALHAPGT
ncbi:MAG: hypothetical protein RI554_04280, partial [Trueperaceae bacterium]|nr:hypothetical protein [Trueperaceae bacterium]